MQWTSTQQRRNQRQHLLRTLANLLSSGLSLTDSLSLLARSHGGTFATQILQFADAIQNGARIAEAATQADWPLTKGQRIALEQAERSGRLSDTMQLLADSDQRLARITEQAWGAARYPLAIGCLSLVIMAGLLIGIVPQFEALYARFQADLPLATQSLLVVSRLLSQWGGLLLILIATLWFGGHRIYRRSESLRLLWHRCLNRLPIIGALRIQLAGLAFSEGMQLYLSAGLALPNALRYSAELIDNSPIQRQLHAFATGIDQGRIDQNQLTGVTFPDSTIGLWQLGMEAGGLPRYLRMNSQHLEAQLDRQLTGLTSLLEPLLMASLGLFVGGFMLALYQPMFTLGALS